jgi:2-octaprenylphenol hydroxylase|tara:strand:- start:1163 stop:2389 length:1227 start_codon:yes stop_codon:yes gene_type:complete
MKQKNKFDGDIVIVGGGITGSSLACLLGEAGFGIILLDADIKSEHMSEKNDPRVFAITIASERILRKAGAWVFLNKENISPFRRMHVWDKNGNGEIHFESASICEPTMGYILPHRDILDALHERICDLENVRHIKGVSPIKIKREADAAILDCNNEQQFKTKLVVAADGSNSKTRELLNIHYQKYDYRQSALASIVTTEIPHDEVARQRFSDDGPLAFLPMKNPYKSGIVWSSSPQWVEELLKFDMATFHSELEAAFDNKLGKIIESTERKVFPLSRAQAEHYVQPRFALIGDSAHTVHPLAGLGANLGLLDTASLAEILIDTFNLDRDIGRLQVLRRYERWRKGENRQIMYLLDGFKYLFENKFQSVQWIRNFGLDVIDDMPIVKNMIMMRAMGLKGNLPKFARNHA